MVRTITCNCGTVLRGNDEELYSQVRAHVAHIRIEEHHPRQTPKLRLAPRIRRPLRRAPAYAL